MTVVSPLLAHYGGLDEIGVFVVPAVAVILFLRWAERRARDRKAESTVEPPAIQPGRQELTENERDGTDR
jgi:hypothetical protein